MSDYKDSPWSGRIKSSLPVSNHGSLPQEEYVIAEARTEIYDKLTNMKHLTQAGRVVAMRNACQPVIELAKGSAQDTKLACATFVELANRINA